MIHPKQDLDLYCVDCKLTLCLKCVITEHKTHSTKDLNKAAAEAKTQIAEDLKRLQDAVSYMIEEVKAEDKEQQYLQNQTRALETAINNRHAAMAAWNDKLRDDMLTSLRATSRGIEDDLKKEWQMKRNNLDQLCQLQQQAQQAVTGDRPQQLLNFAKDMKDGRGSYQTIDKLKSPKRKYITRPAFTFKVSEDVGRKQIEEFMQGRVEKVTMEFTSPEVTVQKQFRCGPEKDIEVFSLSPRDENYVRVSYSRKGLDENAPNEDIGNKGKVLFTSENCRGKVATKATRYENNVVINHKNGNWTYTFSKSSALSDIFMRLSHNISSGITNVDEFTIVSTNKREVKTLFTISQPGPQRAFDTDSSQQLFAVLEDDQAPTEKRRVHLYQRNQKKAVATYIPPFLYSQPSDVCFMKLGGQELLIVADEGTDSLHVVRVTAGGFTFLRYLAPGCPLLVQPTALNTDHEGRLWVACRGGAIITMTPMK